MGHYRDPIKVGRQLSIDFVGPLPRSQTGCTSMCVVIDCFSRYVYVKPMRNPSAEAMVKFLVHEVFRTNGCPARIISDNGPQFRSQTYLTMCAKYKIEAYKTPYYHPQANQVEATNKSIKTCLKAHIESDDKQTSWESYIVKIIDHMNRTAHTSTGVSPNYLHFGRELPLTGDEHTVLNDVNPTREYSDERQDVVMDEARDKQQVRYEKDRRRYDLRSKSRSFVKGQEVWIPNSKQSSAANKYSQKLARPKVRAYIAHRIGSNTYQLIDGTGKPLGKYHANDISTR